VLKGEEDREVRRILRRLSGEVARVARPLTHAVELLARLDLLTAKARLSRDYGMYAPEINTEGRLWLRQARHPVLEHLFREEGVSLAPSASEGETASPSLALGASKLGTKEPRAVVPIDVRLGMGFNLLIVTGPNTGGKTVCLKTAGLLCLMAQSGMHIP